MLTPSELMDSMLEQSTVTAGWTFWDLEPPTSADIEDSQIPTRSVSDAGEKPPEGVSLNDEVVALKKSNEDLSAEIYDLKNTVEHLVRMLGGK